MFPDSPPRGLCQCILWTGPWRRQEVLRLCLGATCAGGTRGQNPLTYPHGRLVLGLRDPGQSPPGTSPTLHRGVGPSAWGRVFRVEGEPYTEGIGAVTCKGSGCHQLHLRGRALPRDTLARGAALSGVQKGGAVCATRLLGGGLGPASRDCMWGAGLGGVHPGFSIWAQAHPRLHCWGREDTRGQDLLDSTSGAGAWRAPGPALCHPPRPLSAVGVSPPPHAPPTPPAWRPPFHPRSRALR